MLKKFFSISCIFIFMLFIGCDGTGGCGGGETDADGDGFTQTDGDCDDTDPAVNPDSPEVCNGIDDNCDGQIDEGCTSQPWNKTFGGTGDDSAASVIRGNDGGYVIAGYATAAIFGNQDAWIIKIDGDGNPLWRKTYGGSDPDSAVSITTGNNGGYVFAGNTITEVIEVPGSRDQYRSRAVVTKIDENGNEQWTVNYNPSQANWAESIIRDHSGGYVIIGTSTIYGDDVRSDVWVIRINEDGTRVWEKKLNSNYNKYYDYNYCITLANDSGYIIGGLGFENGEQWKVIKLDKDGNTLWHRDFSDNLSASVADITRGNDGGYVIAGNTMYTQTHDAWLVKIDEAGNQLWNHNLGVSGHDMPQAVIPGNDGGYLFVGAGSPSNPNYHTFMTKIDEEGNLMWRQVFSEDNVTYYALDVVQGEGGGYLFVGETKPDSSSVGSEIWVVKTDENGNAPATP